MREIVKWIGSFNIFHVCSDDISRRWKPNFNKDETVKDQGKFKV